KGDQRQQERGARDRESATGKAHATIVPSPENEGVLGELGVERRERGAAGNELGVGQRVERYVDRVLGFVQVERVVLDIEEPGDDLAHRAVRLEVREGRDLVPRVVIRVQPPQLQESAVV